MDATVHDPQWPEIAALRRSLARSATVRTSYRTSLLAHPRIRSHAAPPAPFCFSFQTDLESLPDRIDKELRRAGVTEPRLREAVAAETGYLARLFSGLADDPMPWLELSLSVPGAAAEPSRLPDGTRLALACILAPSGPCSSLPGTPPGLEPDTILVLRLEPGTPDAASRAAAPHDGSGLLLWLASPGVPDSRHTDREWIDLPGAGAADVLLVSMPFGTVEQPSLGLSLLKRTLPPGMAEVHYPALAFARRIGIGLYTWLAEFHPYMLALLGEWLFSHAISPRAPGDAQRYLDEVLCRRTRQWLKDLGSEPCSSALIPDGALQEILQVRSLVDGFLDHCVEEIVARRPRIVGLTSVFQQHAASLALARRLKERAPGIAVILGGANCEGPMGIATARNFPFLDAVVCGEGEIVFPRLVERLLAGLPVDDLQGVFTPAAARSGPSHPLQAPALPDLDALPYPDFEDFFRQFAAAGLAGRHRLSLVLETSRGCWWGEKQHCTFCGLNGLGMGFRSKSPERALAELKDMVGRHPGLFVSTADNILDMRYLGTLVPRLAEEGLGLEIFYEVKSNLRKEDLRRMRAAGITRIQPGIESLSDEILRIMRKGVGGLQNIRLLKWCEELGVYPFWNLLWGFPGEPPEEYLRMAGLLPLLHHLPPPVTTSSIYLERFSPNHFQSADLGFSDVRPALSYEHIYGLAGEELDDLAYFFAFGYQDGRSTASYTGPLANEAVRWRHAYGDCRLAMIDRGDHLLICDTRKVAVEPLTFVDGLAMKLLLACDDITTIGRLCAQAAEREGREVPRSLVEETLAPLVERGFLLRQGDSLLALAIPATLAAHGA